MTETLNKESVLVVGLGEIGKTMFELLKDNSNFLVYGLDIDEAKMFAVKQVKDEIPTEVETMHICLPCKNQERFTELTLNYAENFKPKLLIVNSTVPPGTTMKVYQQYNSLVAHSPARGVHKSSEHMKWELKRWTKYVGGANIESGVAAREHFEKLGLKVKTLKSCTETELAKLFETTYRAWMIACFQEMHRISRKAGADFVEVVDFLEDTHRVRLDRPVMFPGVIGGHCLIPNTELLLDAYDSEFLKLILKSNEKRKEEVKDPSVQKEAEAVKVKAEKLQKDIEASNAECQ
jgi:UDP-N-acetyl-D-mannosaminuronate dehydrogenase